MNKTKGGKVFTWTQLLGFENTYYRQAECMRKSYTDEISFA